MTETASNLRGAPLPAQPSTHGLDRVTAHVTRRLAALRADYTFVVTDAALMLIAWLLIRLLTADDFSSNWWVTWRILALAPGIHLLCNAAFGLYGVVWRQAGIEEARRLLASGTAVTMLGLAMALAFNWVPWSLVTLGPILATFMTGLSRFRSRLFAWQRRHPHTGARRVVVVGAGRTGANLVRELLDNPGLGAVPVALVDDDPRLVGRAVNGVPVVASLAALPSVARTWGIDQIVLAIRSADSALVQRTAEAARQLTVPFKVVPAAHEWVTGTATARQVRKPRIEDLLGRSQVETDLAAVRALIEGRTVLLTGAGGSIGTEIARQVAELSPRLLVMLDHDETHLFDARLSIEPANRSRCADVLADIRDTQLMREVFTRFRPEIVFHAAAHKHVPILEAHPLEGIATNVLGTKNLLDAAAAVGGVERFVLISTDKAVTPANVLGATKRVAEQMVSAQQAQGGCYCAVRFGNVLGSRGSVVPTFERQIGWGGPVTLTDPDMTRYFMSIVEAVQLVLQAAVLTNHNDLFLLEMGTPVRILDLAKLMIRLAGFTEDEVPIAIIGARPGEKQAERLSSESERILATSHPSIARVISTVPDLAELERGVRSLSASVANREPEEARRRLFELVRDEAAPSYAIREATALAQVADRSQTSVEEVAWSP